MKSYYPICKSGFCDEKVASSLNCCSYHYHSPTRTCLVHWTVVHWSAVHQLDLVLWPSLALLSHLAVQTYRCRPAEQCTALYILNIEVQCTLSTVHCTFSCFRTSRIISLSPADRQLMAQVVANFLFICTVDYCTSLYGNIPNYFTVLHSLADLLAKQLCH